MRSLVLLLMTVGLVVGFLPLLLEFAQQNLFVPAVEYNGVYEPLRGVEMSRAYETSLDISFDVRAGLFLRRLTVASPVIGACVGAFVGVILHRTGFRLTRQTEE